MKHRFISTLAIYLESPCCGYVDEWESDQRECAGCGQKLHVLNDWFPDSVYEYAILLEDYHNRPPSDMRLQYFEAVREQNWFDYFSSTDKPEFGPTSDWKPITILLFRSLFELLIDHFLWKMIRVQLGLSADAENYADFLTNQFRDTTSKIGKGYKFVTGNTWKADLRRLGYTELYDLLEHTAQVRNSFVHENPLAGHTNHDLANKAKEAVPSLFSLFVRLANEYHHPIAKSLSKVDIVPKKQ